MLKLTALSSSKVLLEIFATLEKPYIFSKTILNQIQQQKKRILADGNNFDMKKIRIIQVDTQKKVSEL